MIKFWRLSLLQKSGTLVALSLGLLFASWIVHYALQGKMTLDSTTSIFGCLFFPSMVLGFGSDGNITCPKEERTIPDGVLVWAIFNVYLLALTIAFYFHVLPVGNGAFVTPLIYGLIWFPVVIWQQNRVLKHHAKTD